ncbi:hypothetical protein NN561_004568 [Cricetulus griseus]
MPCAVGWRWRGVPGMTPGWSEVVTPQGGGDGTGIEKGDDAQGGWDGAGWRLLGWHRDGAGCTGMEQGGGAARFPSLPASRDQGSGGLAQFGVFFASLDFLRSTGRLFHRTGFPRCAGARPALRRPREPPVTLRWVWTRRCATARD